MLSTILTGVYVAVCFLLLLVVLLQQGKGGDIASAFGGGGSSQSAFGARTGATVLTRATAVLGTFFMIGALVLAIVGQQEPDSVVSGIEAPEANPIEPVPGTSSDARSDETRPQ